MRARIGFLKNRSSRHRSSISEESAAVSHPIIRRVVIHAPDDLQDFRIEFPSEGIECFSGER